MQPKLGANAPDPKHSRRELCNLRKNGRGGQIRTDDPSTVLYQTELRPDRCMTRQDRATRKGALYNAHIGK